MDNRKSFLKWILTIVVLAGVFAIAFFIPREPMTAEGSAKGPTPTPSPTPRTVAVYAEYTGDDVVIGNEFNEAKLYVTAVYEDGNEERVFDYRISNKVVKKVGENKFGVYYHGRTAEFFVWGKEELAVTEIFADYKGGDVIVSNSINKKDIEVTAFYNWPEKDPVKLKDAAYSISPSVITKPGNNVITITYEGLKTTIEIYGVAKEVVDAECEYIGKEAIVGSKLTLKDFQLKATYNDNSTGLIEKFQILNPKIVDEGENIITITWQDFVFDIPVQGTPKNSLSEAFRDLPDMDGYSTAIILNLSNAESGKSVDCLKVKPEDIKEAIDRVVVTTKYIGYELTYTDPEAYTEFPILTRVIRPEDYDPEKFAVYYTPNRKTIMAKLNGEYLDDEKTQYAFYMYEPGTYAMLEEISSKLVTSINFEKLYYTMKPDRNLSLEPVVMPLSAADRTVTYWSSDDYVCTVSETGKVYSVGPGECEIWVEANDGSGVYTVVYITVKEK